MTEPVVFNEFKERDLAEVMDVIRGGTATPRDEETWLGNAMTGVLGRGRDGRVVAILPLEPRVLPRAEGAPLRLLWHSAGQVVPDLRGSGLGRKMIAAAVEIFRDRFDGFAVYRDEETGRAALWYRATGHRPVARIASYALTTLPAEEGLTVDTDRPLEEALADATLMDRLTALSVGDIRGCVGQESRNVDFWRRRSTYSYYRKRYEPFMLSLLTRRGELAGYVISAFTKMRGEPRVDLLDMGAAPGLRQAVMVGFVASRLNQGNAEVRVNRCIDELEDLPCLASLVPRWQTTVMAALFSPAQCLAQTLGCATEVWNGASCETAGSGDWRFSCHYEQALALCFGRRTVKDVLSEGAMASSYDPDRLKDVEVETMPWRYSQIDFV